MIHVYSDESWFPDHEVQAVAAIFGTQEACSVLRETLMRIIFHHNAWWIKRSKIRAKKHFLAAAKEIFFAMYDRIHMPNQWIYVLTTHNVSLAYQKLFDHLHEIWYDQFVFYPDKNLTLQWHTNNHLFTGDERFARIIPMTVAQEPLFLIPDLLAWLVRESTERPVLTKIWSTEYTPDRYKQALRQVGKGLLEWRIIRL